MHNGMVNTGGEKMSKSLGNSLIVADVLERARPQAVRYFLGAPHYRSDLDWSEEGLADADAAYTRIENFLERATELVGDTEDGARPQAFEDALNDDLGVPRALGALHETVRAGNAALAEGDKESVRTALGAVRDMVSVLGLSPADFAGASSDAPLRNVLDALVPAMLEAREAARARKDFAEADRIRDALSAAGLVIEDTPTGARWRVESN
jgi:cysteinyl-tRNA synthetase